MVRDWELVHVFLEVARAGTLRQAAAVLPFTQPTLGKRIDMLERELSTKLFYRTKAGMTLTAAGEKLLRMAEEMEGMVHRAAVEVEQASLLTGRIRVAMSDGMAGYWLAPRLRRFHREHPHVTLDIQVLDAGVSVDLTKREADITVMYSYPEDPDVVVLKKSALVLAPFCTRGFVDDWGLPSSLSDVLRFPVCAHPMHYRKEGSMRPWAEMLERHPMVLYRTSSSLVLANIARLGMGISLQPVGIAERETDAVLLDLGVRAELPFYLVCHREVKDIPIVRSILNYLADTLFHDDGFGSPAKIG